MHIIIKQASCCICRILHVSADVIVNTSQYIQLQIRKKEINGVLCDLQLHTASTRW